MRDFPSLLVLRHETFEHLGHLAKGLEDRGIHFTYKDLGQKLRLDAQRGLIVMGGPQSANDDSIALAAEIALIREAIAREIPILGICLGAQLIAKALGARVYRNATEEIGWAPVFFTERAAHDPVLGRLPSPTTFFHWHGETFDLPSGAECLAYSELCPLQAFRFGAKVYGLQFHPEVTSDMIVDWCAQPVNCGGVERLTRPVDAQAHDPGPAALQILNGWLSTL